MYSTHSFFIEFLDISLPSIYAFNPHGIFAIPPILHTLLNEFLIGENYHYLAASAVFYVPFYNILLKLLGKGLLQP